MMIHLNKRTPRTKVPSRKWSNELIVFPMIGHVPTGDLGRATKKVLMLPGLYETRRSAYHARDVHRVSNAPFHKRLASGIIAWFVFAILFAIIAAVGAGAFLLFAATANIVAALVIIVGVIISAGILIGFGVRVGLNSGPSMSERSK